MKNGTYATTDFLMKYYCQFPWAHASILLRYHQVLSSSDILVLPFDSYHQPPFTVSGMFRGDLKQCVCARPHLQCRWGMMVGRRRRDPVLPIEYTGEMPRHLGGG